MGTPMYNLYENFVVFFIIVLVILVGICVWRTKKRRKEQEKMFQEMRNDSPFQNPVKLPENMKVGTFFDLSDEKRYFVEDYSYNRRNESTEMSQRKNNLRNTSYRDNETSFNSQNDASDYLLYGSLLAAIHDDTSHSNDNDCASYSNDYVQDDSWGSSSDDGGHDFGCDSSSDSGDYGCGCDSSFDDCGCDCPSDGD